MTDTSLLQIPDAMAAPSAWPLGASAPEPLALPLSYELDPFQKHAVLGIHAGDHVFVTAKTGSGKTFVGEYLCARALAAGKRVFYTTPIKSLSNQKYHDLKKLFPNATVGILTGDIKMCPDAQIVVMTAEILRNLFYKRGTATEGVGMTAAVSLEGVIGIVMDEVHYIQDPDRGHVWEESLILCPRDLQLVLLSATLPSADTLARWLANLHQRRTVLLSTTYRIVPLIHGVLAPSGDNGGWRVHPVLDSAGNWLSSAYPEWLRGRRTIEDAAAAHRKAVRDRDRGSASGPGKLWNRGEHDKAHDAAAEGLRASKVRVESPIARVQRTVDWLVHTGQCPALFFLFSRRDCERYASQAVQGSLLDSSDTAAAEHIFDFHLSRHRAVLEKSPQYHQVRDLVTRGVAFHHSGLLPLLKEIVEILFTRGYVRALFATETFAVGLNMPTKTVVFLELEKWCDGGMRRPLRPDEYIQMAGRAGRRGLDKQGLVLYEPVRDPIDSGTLKAMLTGGLPPLQSRMRFSYEFLLRLKLLEKAGRSLDIATQSYWAVGQRAALEQTKRELADLEAKVVEAEGRMPAAIVTALAEREALERTVSENVNSKRKKAEAALRSWDLEHDELFPKGQLVVAQQRWRALRETREVRDRLAREVVAWEASPLLNLDREQKCLTAWGFLDTAGELKQMGISATEVNEGHPLLMPWLAASDNTMEAEEIPCVLATFLKEGSARDEEGAPSIAELDLSAAARAAIGAVADRATEWCTYESNHGVHRPESAWRLSRLWPALVARWMAGASVAEIAAEWSLMEGNVQRGLLKVANLLEEWGAVANVRRDLATLEKLASLRFLRDDVIVDSIYLRLN